MSRTEEQGITRRGFIAKMNQRIVGASVSGILSGKAAVRQLAVPDPPGKKLG